MAAGKAKMRTRIVTDVKIGTTIFTRPAVATAVLLKNPIHHLAPKDLLDPTPLAEP